MPDLFRERELVLACLGVFSGLKLNISLFHSLSTFQLSGFEAIAELVDRDVTRLLLSFFFFSSLFLG